MCPIEQVKVACKMTICRHSGLFGLFYVSLFYKSDSYKTVYRILFARVCRKVIHSDQEKTVELNKHNIVNFLLDKAGFSSFTFDCNFSLIFNCNSRKNAKLPFSVRLIIENDWWFGDESEWKQIVREMTADQNYVEPDEPVLAFKLAALRWNTDGTVKKIELSEEKLLIIFESGDSISILNHSDYDCECAWEIVECGFSNSNPDGYWWISCDTSGEIDYNIPTGSRSAF